MTDFNTSSSYYICDLSSFYSYYSHLHGWISLFVCIFGSIANVLNILVLTRREMRSPTNIILMGLAVADLLVMIDYIPYAFHFYLYRRSRRDTFTYGWTIFVLFHSNFSQVNYIDCNYLNCEYSCKYLSLFYMINNIFYQCSKNSDFIEIKRFRFLRL